MLASIGGVVAVGITAALLATAPSFIPPGMLPNAVSLSFDGRVAAVCALTALVVGIVFGLAPAWQSTRERLAEAVSSEGRMTRRGSWLRSGLVSVQVAAAVLVLCGAGLLLRTLIMLQNMDSGSRATEVLTGVISLPFPTPDGLAPYPTADSARRFYVAVEEEVRAVPGVRTVAWGGVLPLDGLWFGQPFAIAGDPPKPLADRDVAVYHMVSADYFAALDVPIAAGRAFTAADTAQTPPVCVVSEARRAGARGDARTPDGDADLSGHAVRPADVRRRADRRGADRGRRVRGTGLARDPRRSGDVVPGRVMKRPLRSWLWRVAAAQPPGPTSRPGGADDGTGLELSAE